MYGDANYHDLSPSLAKDKTTGIMDQYASNDTELELYNHPALVVSREEIEKGERGEREREREKE